MRDVPELTFRGALNLLGQHDRPVLDRLSTVLGSVIMAGGVIAITGPVAAPAVALAAIWGWVDQKNEAVGLIRKLLDRIGEHRAAARGFDRTRLIAAAHTVLVVSSVVDAFRQAVGEKYFKCLEITDKELVALPKDPDDQRLGEWIYDSTVPLPSSGRGFAQTLADIRDWQGRFAQGLQRFSVGVTPTGTHVPHVDSREITDESLRRYQEQYRKLAAQVPEFLVWSLMNEFSWTQELVADVGEDVRTALDVQVRAMGRLESLLAAVCGAVPDQVTALKRVVQGGLYEPVVARDRAAVSMLAGIRFPLVHEIFVQPGYRIERVDASSRIADEQWWHDQPRRDELDLRLAAHLTSLEATRLPMLVLGHPGAGKSMLMKVLAARLPSAQYTTVYAPLRHVSSTVPVYEQVNQALAMETNGKVDWAGLAHQSQHTTLVVLLDGLDEMLQASERDRTGYLHEVVEFQWREALQGRPVVVLVTSRTLVADRVDVPSGTTVVKLEEFDSDQIEQWREVWNSVNRTAIAAGAMRKLTGDAVSRQHELARQPLLLLMLAIYSADPEFPPIGSNLSKTALYRTLFTNFTGREATKLPGAASPREQLERLSVVALGMFNRGRQYITDVELAADLAVLAADGEPRVDAEQRLVAQFFFVHTAEANLGTDRARRSYEFLHATFGEYLVAREVMDTLVDTADSTVGRRGAKEPDDDRLFALLSHDSLAARGPILDFIDDLLVEQSPEDRERISDAIVTLLAGARRRQSSARYADYRPVGTDNVRAVAAYTANLVLLATLVEPRSGVRLDTLVGDETRWRATLDLWRAGLPTNSWHALLSALTRDADRLRIADDTTQSTGLEAELRQAELADDFLLANTLRMGRMIRDSARLLSGSMALATPWELNANSEELIGWLVATLAFGRDPESRPMRKDRLVEILAAHVEYEYLLPMISMVLKQRARFLDVEIVRELVRHLLEQRLYDTVAFMAALGAHPRLLADLRHLVEANRDEGAKEIESMLRGAGDPSSASTQLIESTPPDKDPAVYARALLDAFQWRVEK